MRPLPRFPVFWLRGVGALAAAALAVILLVPAAGSAAGGAPDVRGTWNQNACVGGTLADCKAHPTYPSSFTITDVSPSGAISGTMTPGGYAIHGTQNGATVVIVESYSGYTSTATFTVDAGNTAMDGSFDDTYGRTAQPAFALRAGAPPTSTSPTPTPTTPTTTPTTPTPPTLRPTAVQVFCNYLVASEVDTCTASVADASGQGVTPTGSVHFTASNGAPFVAGATCSLTQVPSGVGVASCSVQLLTPGARFPTITADYSGDGTHAPASGTSQFLFAGPGTSAYVPTIQPFSPPTLSFDVVSPAAGATVTATGSITSDLTENGVCGVGGDSVGGSGQASAAVAAARAKVAIVSARMIKHHVRAGKLRLAVHFNVAHLAAAFPRSRRVQVIVVTTITPRKGQAIKVYRRRTLTLRLTGKLRAQARRIAATHKARATSRAAASATWSGTSACGTFTITAPRGTPSVEGYANWPASLACDDGTFVQQQFTDHETLSKEGTIYTFFASGPGYTVGAKLTGGSGIGSGGITAVNRSGARCTAVVPPLLTQTQ